MRIASRSLRLVIERSAVRQVVVLAKTVEESDIELPCSDRFYLLDANDSELIASRPVSERVVNQLTEVRLPGPSLVNDRDVPSSVEHV